MKYQRIGFLPSISILTFVVCISASNANAAPGSAPESFVVDRAQRILSELKRRPLRLPVSAEAEPIKMGLEVNKAEWLRTLYSRHLIEASWASEMLSDKRLVFEVLSRELGEKARAYYPKTIGLREFLVKKGLVNKKGELIADGEQIEKALYEEFSAGFVVRPAVGIAPRETGRGLYRDSDAFIMDLVAPGSRLYSPSHLKRPVRSHILNSVASGEAIVLQEDIVAAAEARKALKARYFQEVRIHTYEDSVVPNAVPDRWVQAELLKPEQIKQAEEYVVSFLKLLPKAFVQRQAWGIDVAVMDNGEMRIAEILTNRGKPTSWSGYLDQPRVIAAYTKHLEQETGVRFVGFGGLVARKGLANYFPYWGMRIERARPGLSKALAYLPPVP